MLAVKLMAAAGAVGCSGPRIVFKMRIKHIFYELGKAAELLLPRRRAIRCWRGTS